MSSFFAGALVAAGGRAAGVTGKDLDFSWIALIQPAMPSRLIVVNPEPEIIWAPSTAARICS